MTDQNVEVVETSTTERGETQHDKLTKKMLGGGVAKRVSKRGRRPSKVDVKVKLERSRQSARECRARKKLRYQYLEELVNNRERAVFALRSELEQLKEWCKSVDHGQVPDGLKASLAAFPSPLNSSPAAGAQKFALKPEVKKESPYDILVDVLGAPREDNSGEEKDADAVKGTAVLDREDSVQQRKEDINTDDKYFAVPKQTAPQSRRRGKRKSQSSIVRLDAALDGVGVTSSQNTGGVSSSESPSPMDTSDKGNVPVHLLF